MQKNAESKTKLKFVFVGLTINKLNLKSQPIGISRVSVMFLKTLDQRVAVTNETSIVLGLVIRRLESR